MNLVPQFSEKQIQKINDAKDYEIVKQVHIDSMFRKDYMTTTSNNFLFEMPEPVKNVMTPNFQCVQLEDTIDDLPQIMLNGNFRHLPVVEGRNVVGIISIKDLLRILDQKQ